MIETIRDIFIIVYLGVGILFTLALLIVLLVLFRTLIGMFKSAKRSMDNVTTLTDLTITKIAKPLAGGISFGSALGGAYEFISTIFGGLRKRGSPDKD